MAAARSGKHAEVLREAARLFTVSGYHGTSMDDIAAAVGVTKAALYHYFGSKSDILYEISGAVVDEISGRLDEHAEDLEPPERLRMTMRDMLRVISAMPVEVTVYMQEGPLLSACLPRRQAKELRTRESRFNDYVIETVEAGMKQGSIRSMDPTLTAFALIGMVSWAARWYRAQGKASVDEIADLFFGIARSGFDPAGRVS